MHAPQTLRAKLTTIESLFAGACAGAVAKTCIAPLDRLKIMFQVHVEKLYSFRNLLSMGRDVAVGQGVLALWRGHGATLIRVIPQAAIAYTSYNYYEHTIAKLRPDGTVDAFTRFLAGALAGASGQMATYPLDVIRATLAADHSFSRPTYIEHVRNIIREGGARALYRGVTPTFLGIIPYAGLAFMSFGTLKALTVDYFGYQNQKLPIPLHLFVGSVSGFFAQSLTYPLDTVRRRMQVLGGADVRYRSMRSACVTIYTTEGARALFKGLSMNWFKGPVSVGISFFTNDFVTSWLRSRKARGGTLLQPSV